MASFMKSFCLGSHPRPRVRYTPRAAPSATSYYGQSRLYHGQRRKTREVTYVDVVLWARLAVAGEYLKGRRFHRRPFANGHLG
jgi:single-stranded DNA-binding protein